MAIHSDREDWGSVAKALHWAMAAGILTMLACGTALAWFLDSAIGLKFALYQFHKSLGIVLLCLAAMRLAWRLLSAERPELPSDMKPYERWLAEAVHFGVYACLCALPVIGWVAASASPLNIPTVVFGIVTLPRLVGPNAAFEHLLTETHALLAWALMGLLAVHVSGAIWHHVVRGDNTLRRMLLRKSAASPDAGPLSDRQDI